MKISASSSSIHSGGHVNKASIERQIRRLEEQKARLIEKLGGGGGSSGQDSAELSTGTMAIGGQKPSGEGESLGASLGQALRAFSQSLSEPPAVPEGESEDPKEIMKKIQLIEMQIMTLKQQLGDDSMSALEPEGKSTEEVAAMATAAVEARTAEALSAGEGHVDTYA